MAIIAVLEFPPKLSFKSLHKKSKISGKRRLTVHCTVDDSGTINDVAPVCAA